MIHMKVPDPLIWDVLFLWSNPAKTSRVNAGRMMIDTEKI